MRTVNLCKVHTGHKLVAGDDICGAYFVADCQEAARASGPVKQLTGGGAHRDAVHAGPLHVTGHGEELQARVVAAALGLPPGRAPGGPGVPADRPGLFPEDIDASDPWQFRNVLVR